MPSGELAGIGESHTERVMVVKRLVFGACVVAVALLVAAGSRGTMTKSDPRPPARPPAVLAAIFGEGTGVPGGGTGLVNVGAHLGPCPSRYATIPLAKLNAGIKELNKRLVPLDASAVRICKYVFAPNDHVIPSGLIVSGQGVLKAATATAFEAETNRLPKLVGPIPFCPRTMPPVFYLTFASRDGSSRRVASKWLRIRDERRRQARNDNSLGQRIAEVHREVTEEAVTR